MADDFQGPEGEGPLANIDIEYRIYSNIEYYMKDVKQMGYRSLEWNWN